MKYSFLLPLILFFSCASQGTPSGGPIDSEGPSVVNYESDYNSKDIKITIIFNEIINPSSVTNSVSLNGHSNFDLKVKYNKIIISSINSKEDILELNISRNISDYQGNTMDAPIIKFFSREKEITKNKISGKLIDILDEKTYEIAIYQVYADSIVYLKKTQADINGNFKFENIYNGKYRLAALEGIINDFNQDYRFNRYGIQSQDIVINKEFSDVSIQIIMDEPLPRHKIIGANMISRNHAIITLSDGLEKSFYIESPKITGDSVDITIAYFNRLEKYDIEPFSFIANVPEDTLCPEIDNYFKIEDKLVVNFSEPIKFLKKDVFIKDNKKPLYYDVIDPFSASIHIGDISDETIYINNASIVDFSDNVLDSLIAIDISQSNDLNLKFGSLKGLVQYDGKKDIAVRIINNESFEEYYTLAESGSFKFDRVIPGTYSLDSYELKNTYGNRDFAQENMEVYYSGLWEPFEKSARFAIYPDYIDVRAHWTIEGINIVYD